MKVCVLGGGPGGLFFARLFKRSLPEARVEVVEQNPVDASFGFGVAIGPSALDRMRQRDPAVHAALDAASMLASRQCITVNGQALVLDYPESGGAIRRLDLLAVLQQACVEAGVVLRHDTRVDDVEELLRANDLLVAADGANSIVRQHFEAAFAVQSQPTDHHFAWFGLSLALDPPGLDFVHTPFGPFVGHYYAYGEAASTFVPECGDATWQAAGLDRLDDAGRRRFVQELFAHRLGGAPLLENKSVWRRFAATHAQRWHHRNAVLIGDALRVAHYSIGSGTRLAMEDAMALHDALVARPGDLQAGFAHYEATRRPVRDAFGEAALRSIGWYEGMGQRMQLPLMEFVHSYLTRTGRVPDERLASYVPGFHRLWMAYKANAAA
jgi:2-polyprenyl-6-methoxyphenol hydroxylase-like FAD-dependent oxidoreductase